MIERVLLNVAIENVKALEMRNEHLNKLYEEAISTIGNLENQLFQVRDALEQANKGQKFTQCAHVSVERRKDERYVNNDDPRVGGYISESVPGQCKPPRR